VIGDPDEAMAACEAFLQEGFFAQAIRPPTVPDGTSRLRLVATASHDSHDLQRVGYSSLRREVVPTGGVRQHGR